VVLVEGNGISARPFLRKEFDSGFWLEAEGVFTRWMFLRPLDDYWEIGPVVSAGYNFGKSADVTASYTGAADAHEQWQATDRFGRLPPHAPLLEIWQDRGEVAWHQYWDSTHHWRSTLRLGMAYEDDNGGGFLNHYQYLVGAELRWQNNDWQIKGGVQESYEDYPIQGTGISNGETLYRILLDASLSIERRIYKTLKGYAKVQYQRARSDKIETQYIATTIVGGLSFEF